MTAESKDSASPPPEFHALCPKCNGLIKTTTESCGHCNAWLGSNSVDKPIAIDEVKAAEVAADAEKNAALLLMKTNSLNDVAKGASDLAGKAFSKAKGLVDEEEKVQVGLNLITSKLGLENIEQFSLKQFFSKVFEKHNPDEVENLFVVGSKQTTPPLDGSMAILPSPWLFFRVLLGSVIVYLIFLLGWNSFKNSNLIPGLIMVGSFAVPISVVILFFELNTPRNISIIRIVQLFFLSGALSLFVTLILFDLTPALGALGASSAALVEEPAKLAVVIFAMRMIGKDRYKYRLNALLFGAAVGAGFSAFESAGYAFNYLLRSGVDASTSVIFTRGVLAPFQHIVWTAIATSAYWIARKDHPNMETTIRSKKFLLLFAAPVTLHFIWNLPFEGPYMAKFWGLGVIAWVIVFSLIQSGLKEISALTAVKTDDLNPPANENKV
jgi:RsiW-degrading membrane proteinase PrsW (M82 family)